MLLEIFLILLLPLLIFGGIYLLFSKRKTIKNPQPASWIQDLPESAKKVRLKEFNKKTQKVLTWKWFVEYWQGQRSPFNAWFTWHFVVPFVLVSLLIAALFTSVVNLELHKTVFIAWFLYNAFSLIILWRCAFNTTSFYKNFTRLYVVAALFLILFRLFSINY